MPYQQQLEFGRKSALWQKADQQADQIRYLKDRRAKKHQIHMLCDTWKQALKSK